MLPSDTVNPSAPRRARVCSALLACLFPAAGLAQAGPGSAGPPRPNILFLIADDLGWADVGWRGGEDAPRTPTLDALQQEGSELLWHYVQPQCTPTRVALMTGRYPSRFNDHCVQASNERAFPADTPTLPRLLRHVGYETCLTGKWHLGSEPEAGPQHHFDHSYGSFAGAVGMYDHRYRLNNPHAVTWHRNGEYTEDVGHVTDLVADEAIRWLEDRDADTPWFLYVPFHAVHVPLVETQKWIKQNAHIEDPDRRLLAAAASHLDAAIGRILAAVDKRGETGETLVVFTSDNGGLRRHGGGAYPPPDTALARISSNAPLRGWKVDVFEGGIRVPTLVRWPGHIPPGARTQVMHAVDWVPTFAALAGAAAPAGDGVDIGPWLRDPQRQPADRQLYWKWNKKLALRDGPWKLVRNKGNAAFSLFNLAEDPGEQNDLASANPAKRDELRTALRAQVARDAVPLGF